MTSSNARLLADGGAGGGSSNYSAGSFHGFFRDSTGKLIYTKKALTDNTTRIELTDGSVLDDATDFTAGGRNDADRKQGENYDQWLLDSSQLSFYIDDKGFLVAELNEGTSYNGPN